jgi:hypothetical protein
VMVADQVNGDVTPYIVVHRVQDGTQVIYANVLHNGTSNLEMDKTAAHSFTAWLWLPHTFRGRDKHELRDLHAPSSIKTSHHEGSVLLQARQEQWEQREPAR